MLAEANAAGVPVIAMDLGSCREVIEQGVTGFLVNDVAEAVKALDGVPSIQDSACRSRVEQRFSIATMVAAYERSTPAFLTWKGKATEIPIILSVDDKGNRGNHYRQTLTGLRRPSGQGKMVRVSMSQGATASEIVLSEQVGSRALMLFDGLCGLCNSAVRWVTQQDHADRFRFAPCSLNLPQSFSAAMELTAKRSSKATPSTWCSMPARSAKDC